MTLRDPHKILPAGVLDASHATDSIILTGWVLNQQVDPLKIRTAWSKLVTVWPLLVARLRRNPKTQAWEYHIPETPTLKNSFACLQISALLREHYRYSTPSASISVTLKENPHHLFCPYGPRSVDDLLNEDQDRPLLHLHVTCFEDGSLIGLATPHILCDGHGVSSIMSALCELINGGPAPPALDYTDPFERYAQELRDNVEVPSPPSWRVLNRVESVVLYARMIWERLWEDRIENRDVYFPKDEVIRIKERAMSDIRKVYGEGTNLYVSSSDAVLAFCLQCAHRSSHSRAPLSVFYTANMRPFLTSTLKPPYLRNTVLMPIVPPITLNDVSSMPLGEFALCIRRTLDENMEEPARERWLLWRLKNCDENRVKVFFDPWRGAWDVVTNWREMDLMGLDFSGAHADLTERIKCVYAWGNGLQPYAIKNWFGLWADDPSGGIWTSAFLQKKIWEDKQGFGQFIPSHGVTSHCDRHCDSDA